MHFNTLLVFLCATGAIAAPRILGCRMPNGALNPSGNICTAAGGKVAGTVRLHLEPSGIGNKKVSRSYHADRHYTGQMLH